MTNISFTILEIIQSKFEKNKMVWIASLLQHIGLLPSSSPCAWTQTLIAMLAMFWQGKPSLCINTGVFNNPLMRSTASGPAVSNSSAPDPNEWINTSLSTRSAQVCLLDQVCWSRETSRTGVWHPCSGGWRDIHWMWQKVYWFWNCVELLTLPLTVHCYIF